MKPEDKAKEMINKYFNAVDHRYTSRKLAKKLSLIAIDEILLTNPTIKGNSQDLVTMIVQTKAYWHRVQEFIIKL